ncbi:MAG: galactose mutarotase [Prevotellaceae bacterium]|jgi:aldose 1-epimerase|nr:galactose mutarotase [Prevotellaceae bacterium]
MEIKVEKSFEPAVDKFIVTNNQGYSVSFINYGANWIAANVPDKDGEIGDVVLGYNTIIGYQEDTCYIGTTVGRFANRIENAEFNIDGKKYKIETNGQQHSLHGGAEGFSRRIWDSKVEDDGVTFTLVSPDGDQGFPGKLLVSVRYRWNDNNCLRIEFAATTDKPTPVNLTNHAYFNLNSRALGKHGNRITGHELKINAESYLPMKEGSIVTGEIAPVEGTPFDFRTSKPIGRDIEQNHQQLLMCKGYDHSYLIKNVDDGKLQTIAEVFEPESGRLMEVRSTCPTVHLYTGNYLSAGYNSKKELYDERDGFCLETQYAPNSPNLPIFPNCILRPGQTYNQVTEFQFKIKK